MQEACLAPDEVAVRYKLHEAVRELGDVSCKRRSCELQKHGQQAAQSAVALQWHGGHRAKHLGTRRRVLWLWQSGEVSAPSIGEFVRCAASSAVCAQSRAHSAECWPSIGMV